ncbi:MAG TPA: ABC transporter substrate-binding protein [Actinomycetota bacterium]|nr:ABC transporter substrate-binding protein [Actinomycetota bacterium]
MKKHLMLIALVSVLALVAASCGGDEEPSETGPTGPTAETGAITQGGVVREELTDFGFTGAFDPTGEYLGTAWSWYQQMLIRGLLMYPGEAGEAGNVPVPDLATDLGQVSADGLTITFTLKDGVMFGPPVDREITSQDIAFAFQRINTASLVAQYGNYYCGTIVGMTCDAKSQDDPIEGIATPDDKTIVFTLERPTGDLLYRLAQPATYAMPPEVAGCFDKAGDYGRFLISSGPYMFMGSEDLDITSCDTMKPIDGWDPDSHMWLVRNPNYDKATDDVRLSNFDGWTLTINTNLEDSYNKLLNGELDLLHGAPPAAILQQYLTNPDLQDNFKSEEGDRTWYITMNLLVPPFDDIHVRKAANFVVDKAAMLQATGGPSSGLIATTVEPPSVLPDLAEYDPYPSPNQAGDVEAAKAEMAQSRYDKDGDGVCDDPVCDNVLMVNRNYEPWTEYTPILQENFKAIGINLKIRELEVGTSYTTIQTMNNLVPIAVNAGWGKDYGSPYGFDFFLFNTAGLACEGSVNYSNIGITEDVAKECGDNVVDAYNAAVKANGEIPSVDADMEACVATPLGAEYNACWAALDTKLMEEIVPWVPYRWGAANIALGDSIENYVFDQSAGLIAYSKIGTNNGLTMEEVTGTA